jgi:carboxyl-terminal processing protease
MPRRNLLVIAMVGAVSLLWWQSSQGAKPKDEMMELYGTFVDAVELVEANYVRPVSRRELLESALKEMLQGLDPHSTYISAGDWKQFKKQMEGSFSGIGIQVGMDAEAKRLKVIAPVVGSPAYQAGVLPGDIILEIDGKTTEGLIPDKAVEVLQGRPGTQVALKVLHEGIEKAETLTITRAIIDLPSVLGDARKPDDSWDFLIDHDRKIGYIRLTSFIQNTTEELKKALAELKGQGLQALILDLRDNPGGLLTSAVEVSDLFVSEGRIVSTKGRNTREKIFEAEKEGTYEGFPMVVLVNGHSASAAEIVSACLQDHDRALVVGQRSYGKGSVQNILPLEDGDSVLKLTVATYWRPSGKNIHKFTGATDKDEWGVSPSPGLEVKLSERDYESWAMARRDRDLISQVHRPAPKPDSDRPKAARPTDDPGPKPRVDDPKKEHVRDMTESDRQLKKALEVIRAKLAPPAAAAARG